MLGCKKNDIVISLGEMRISRKISQLVECFHHNKL